MEKQSKPLISIVIPVYNVENYLARCLDSILAQKYPNIEILCINDGATDSSAEILKAYARKYAPVLRVISQNNQGLSGARNRGIKEAKGEWLLFVDSDDYIASETLSVVCGHISEDIDLLCWGAKAVAEKEENIPWIDIQNSHLRLRFCGVKDFTLKVARKTPVTVWNKLFRTNIVRSHGIDFPECCLFEDNAFYWKYFPFCRRAYFMPENYYFYTQRQQSIMGRLFNNRLPPDANGCKVAMDIVKFYQRHDLFKKYEKELQRIFQSLFFLDFDHVSPAEKKTVIRQSQEILSQIPFRGLNKFLKAIMSGEESVLEKRNAPSFLETLFSVRKEQGKKNVIILGKRFR